MKKKKRIETFQQKYIKYEKVSEKIESFRQSRKLKPCQRTT